MSLKSNFIILVVLLSLTYSQISNGQGVYAPVNSEYNSLIQRYEIQSNQTNSQIHTSFKPYRRIDIVRTFENDSLFISRSDKFNREYFLNDNHEWTDSSGNSEKPLFRHFYEKKANAFYFNHDGQFEIHADPILNISISNENENSELIYPALRTENMGGQGLLYRNTRGALIRGMINKKIGFQSSITENQIRFPNYVKRYTSDINAIPGVGFIKNFGKGENDYFIARGYITAQATKNINIQFGHDQNFIGDGFRSLILSDFATPYLFLKVETQIWKIKYTNLFTQMVADRRLVNGVYPKKYMALHHLSMNIGNKLNVGLFESVIYGRGDSIGSGSYELSYLNPIIFYRAIEQNLGSPDNVILGANWRYIISKHFSYYGQFILDELIISNLRAGNGWWGNKFGIQSGIKYINAFGVKNLDLQSEFNAVRPYTYAHNNNVSSYQHFRQPLAHPLGANFYETMFLIRYQPVPKLTFRLSTVYTQLGTNIIGSNNVNVGQNVNDDYRTRIKDFDNKIAQGTKHEIYFTNFNLSYMIRHNLFLDLKYTARFNNIDYELGSATLLETSSIPLDISFIDSHILGIGLRWNAFLSPLVF